MDESTRDSKEGKHDGETTDIAHTHAESIPVCTLFNDPLNVNEILNQPSKRDPDETEDESQVSLPKSQSESPDFKPSRTPALCDVFTSDRAESSLEDIFSDLSNEQNTDPPMESIEVPSGMVKNDSFVIEDLIEEEDVPGTEQTEHEDDSSSSQPVPNVSIISFGDKDDRVEVNKSDADKESPIVGMREPSLNDPVVEMEMSKGSENAQQGEKLDNLNPSGLEGGLLSENTSNIEKNFEDAPTGQDEGKNAGVQLHSKKELMTPSSKSLFSSGVNEGGKDIFAEGDDAFATALCNSESDRRRDAWIPSANTRSLLMAVQQSQKNVKLESGKLTKPGLSTTEFLGIQDPVKELVSRLTGSESILKRENLTMDSVQQNITGIKQLIKTSNLRGAVNLCAKLLAAHGQGYGFAGQITRNTPETVELWFVRISILIRLKLFEVAATELSRFGDLDNADMYYEFYPDLYPGRRGSMVPFSFHLLYAEFCKHVDKPQESLKRLHKVSDVCEKILKNLRNDKTEMGEDVRLNSADREASIKHWIARKIKVLFSLGNVLMQLKDYSLAIDIYDRILKLQPEKTIELQSGIGRIFLHLGNVRAAQQRFTEAEKAGSTDPRFKVQLTLNRGFMYIGTNHWKEAYDQFEQALTLDPKNIIALNNKAVCLLYLGKLKDAIAVLESGMSVKRGSENVDMNWLQNMNEGVLSNLATLYELESSRYVTKKRTLFLKQVAPDCGDSLDVTCLKEI